MPPLPKPRKLSWTLHAQAKMMHWRLSPMRVRRVLNSPRRIEEGVAPKTVAMMQPVSLKSAGGRSGAKTEARWTQEIWVMIQDKGGERKVISAWRYPGMTKPRSEASVDLMRKEYNEYMNTVRQ